MVHPKEKAEARKRLFATRFKTEMCRTYEIQGSCPYTHKCMFAHGTADLRTEEMNERDGLTSALAVRRWMLGLIYSNHRQGHRGNHGHHHDSDHTTSDDEPLHHHHQQLHQHQHHPMQRIAHSSKPSTPKMVSGAHFVEFDECVKPRTGTWRHEPYSWIVPFVTCCSHDHHHQTDSD